jgi:hypothetical protein
MKSTRQPLLYLILAIACAVFASKLWAKDTLHIDKAFVGATDAWRDVTLFLQDQIQNDALTVNIAQPFNEIGGDPAPGRVKNLIVDYRFNGQPYRLCLKEEFPLAFGIKIPSPDAEAPGANPQVTALMENISSSATLHASRNYREFLIYATVVVSLAALVFSIFALAQVRQLRKASNTATSTH